MNGETVRLFLIIFHAKVKPRMHMKNIQLNNTACLAVPSRLSLELAFSVTENMVSVRDTRILKNMRDARCSSI